jgi:hypothetical protein
MRAAVNSAPCPAVRRGDGEPRLITASRRIVAAPGDAPPARARRAGAPLPFPVSPEICS